MQNIIENLIIPASLVCFDKQQRCMLMLVCRRWRDIIRARFNDPLYTWPFTAPQPEWQRIWEVVSKAIAAYGTFNVIGADVSEIPDPFLLINALATELRIRGRQLVMLAPSRMTRHRAPYVDEIAGPDCFAAAFFVPSGPSPPIPPQIGILIAFFPRSNPLGKMITGHNINRAEFLQLIQ